ncbi:methylase involved in ubiquinone/menaquinone biosynthesis [Pleurocapsa sp. PCC 7327]|nr:methylase involved in ubiquinone/menaquinone biosynthesis [Pleurocapsa sp. PCC 7327]
MLGRRKKLLKPIYSKLMNVSPSLYFLLEYGRAAKKLHPVAGQRDKLFDEFIKSCQDKKCLQIGVKESMGKKFGPNWISVDKYDKREFIDYHYDIHDLKFEDESFDAAVCWSILEHVPYPQKAIAELHRVLKPNGKIWVQLPFHYPFHEEPKDYWRVTPDGLRIWLEDFDEIACGCDFWAKTPTIAATYFYGTKR